MDRLAFTGYYKHEPAFQKRSFAMQSYVDSHLASDIDDSEVCTIGCTYTFGGTTISYIS